MYNHYGERRVAFVRQGVAFIEMPLRLGYHGESADETVVGVPASAQCLDVFVREVDPVPLHREIIFVYEDESFPVCLAGENMVEIMPLMHMSIPAAAEPPVEVMPVAADEPSADEPSAAEGEGGAANGE